MTLPLGSPGMSPAALVTFGEPLGVLTSHEVGPVDLNRTFVLGVGGAEFNVAVGAARLGIPVTYGGRIGDDAVGELISHRARADRLEGVLIQDTRATGLMLKHRRVGGLTEVSYARANSAGAALCIRDLPWDALDVAGALHLTGVTPALSSSAREATSEAVSRASRRGVRVSMDVNYRHRLWAPAEAAEFLGGLLPYVDILFASTTEARLLLGLSGEEPNHTPAGLAKALCARGPNDVIIKTADHGCTALVDGQLSVLSARPVVVMDPVGAGDAFAAGYLAGALRGDSPAERLAAAMDMGAYATSVAGDCEGLPNRRELSSYLEGIDVRR